MCRERPGTVAMFSGRNRGKIQGILAAIEAGIDVLADKPLIIRREDLSALETALNAAQDRRACCAAIRRCLVSRQQAPSTSPV